MAATCCLLCIGAAVLRSSPILCRRRPRGRRGAVRAVARARLRPPCKRRPLGGCDGQPLRADMPGRPCAARHCGSRPDLGGRRRGWRAGRIGFQALLLPGRQGRQPQRMAWQRLSYNASAARARACLKRLVCRRGARQQRPIRTAAGSEWRGSPQVMWRPFRRRRRCGRVGCQGRARMGRRRGARGVGQGPCIGGQLSGSLQPVGRRLAQARRALALPLRLAVAQLRLQRLPARRAVWPPQSLRRALVVLLPPRGWQGEHSTAHGRRCLCGHACLAQRSPRPVQHPFHWLASPRLTSLAYKSSLWRQNYVVPYLKGPWLRGACRPPGTRL